VDLKTKLPPADQTKITFRYQEEFSRYTQKSEDEDSDTPRAPVSGSRPNEGILRARNRN
jgi:hypothetical protein